MFEKFVGFALSDSGRRFFAWVVSTLLIAMNKKWGLDLNVPELVAIVTGTGTYTVGGNLKAAAVAKADAAVKVASAVPPMPPAQP